MRQLIYSSKNIPYKNFIIQLQHGDYCVRNQAGDILGKFDTEPDAKDYVDELVSEDTQNVKASRKMYTATSKNYQVGRYKAPGLDAVLEYLGFTFLPEDPDIACMLDPSDSSAVDVYDANTGDITRYEGANIDGTGEAFVNAMRDYENLQDFLADNNVHIVRTNFDNLIY